jgi:hypothetical protein
VRSVCRTVESVATADPDLAFLIDRWPALTEDARAAILRLAAE